MKTNHMIPVLDSKCVAGTKWIFCIQKIIKYDDSSMETYSDYIGAWDSDTGEIDQVMQKIRKNEEDFCKNNKQVKPFTFTLRKVAIECKMSVVDKTEDYFGNSDYKPLRCTECGCQISYGDDFITDPMNDVVYCSSDCFMISHGVVHHDSCDDNYDQHFISK